MSPKNPPSTSPHPPQPGNQPAAAPPPPAIKQSPFRFILPLLLIAAAFALIFILARPLLTKLSPSSSSITLNYWGLWEDAGSLQSLIDQYQASHPNLHINYTQQKITDYRERLQTALNSNQGPDIFRFHQTWVPMLADQLAVIPPNVMDATTFQATFYPSFYQSLNTPKGLVGLPLMFDGLGLYYNLDHLNSLNQPVPKTWDELRRTALLLRVPQTGPIIRAGVALGTTSNVEHWPDILAMMFMQNSADLKHPNNHLGTSALEFYTLFSRLDKVWDDTMPAATYAFATEKVTFMLAPSWRVHDVLAINSNLNFAIAPVPQLPETNLNWSSSWVEGVSSRSSKEVQAAAWEFLNFLAQKDNLRQWYTQISQSSRRFGELFPRLDMADQLLSDNLVGPFIASAPTAQSWYLSSATFDNGLNDQLIKYYQDAVNAVNAGTPAADALAITEQGVTQILQKYSLH